MFNVHILACASLFPHPLPAFTTPRGPCRAVKGGSADRCCREDGPGEHCAKQNKPVRKRQILYVGHNEQDKRTTWKGKHGHMEQPGQSPGGGGGGGGARMWPLTGAAEEHRCSPLGTTVWWRPGGGERAVVTNGIDVNSKHFGNPLLTQGTVYFCVWLVSRSSEWSTLTGGTSDLLNPQLAWPEPTWFDSSNVHTGKFLSLI